MSRLFISLNLIAILVVGLQAQDQQVFRSNKLTPVWETPQALKVPESVCFDPAAGLIYVSNIDGKPTDKDGNGFLSVLNSDGSIGQLNWVVGLNAPKGMGITNGRLFVTDIDRVAEIDIATARIIRFYDFPGAQFLNDIAVEPEGAVYVSDMMSTKIYKIKDGLQETWLDDELLSGPNGLYVEGNELLIGCQKIVRVDLAAKKMSVWLEGTGGIDGLEAVGDGRYIFSDWQGNVYLVGADKQIEKILDTTPASINAADIEFIPERKMLLVPTFFDNRVMAYELK
jgi:DNA-binding beta-propeller fold protein YncE